MLKLERCRISVDEEIEFLRGKLNRQTDFTGREAIKISVQLDRLILLAMKENGYRGQSSKGRIRSNRKNHPRLSRWT